MDNRAIGQLSALADHKLITVGGDDERVFRVGLPPEKRLDTFCLFYGSPQQFESMALRENQDGRYSHS